MAAAPASVIARTSGAACAPTRGRLGQAAQSARARALSSLLRHGRRAAAPTARASQPNGSPGLHRLVTPWQNLQNSGALATRWGRATAAPGARARLRRAVGRAALSQAEAHGQAVRVRVGRPAELRRAPHRLQRLQLPAAPRCYLRAGRARRLRPLKPEPLFFTAKEGLPA